MNPFFKNFGPFNLKQILSFLNLSITLPNSVENILIKDVKDLSSASTNELTFFHNKNYEKLASTTKASCCITLENLAKYLPNTCEPIIVDNVLLSIAEITKKFYPTSVTDDFDSNVVEIEKTSFKDNVFYGRNIFIGKNVQIGKNCKIGHNSIIESNVIIGDDCTIGSNVIIRNSLIKNNVSILDGAIIGKKGFGFFPNKDKNIRYPHVGIVIIDDNCEIGCGATIDRGSMSNTVIGKNTYIDNQVHIAHNNKIGENCIVAGQVGFAGSSSLGNNVMIGGQAGISGHLKIGDNVQIGGGSGVLDDLKDNSKVMGYPATSIRNFLKEKKSILDLLKRKK